MHTLQHLYSRRNLGTVACTRRRWSGTGNARLCRCSIVPLPASHAPCRSCWPGQRLVPIVQRLASFLWKVTIKAKSFLLIFLSYDFMSRSWNLNVLFIQQVTFFNKSPPLSLFALFISAASSNHDYPAIEIISFFTIMYMCICAYYTIFKWVLCSYSTVILKNQSFDNTFLVKILFIKLL